jgi:DNA-directed RNA polymerase subunit beta
MSLSYHLRSTHLRKSFGRVTGKAQVPDLIEIQKKSYQDFLMQGVDPAQRGDHGLQSVFQSVFPITDYTGTVILEFVKYDFDEPKYDLAECRVRSLTYSAPLRATLRLVVFE